MDDDAAWDDLIGDLYLSAVDAEAGGRLPSAIAGFLGGATIAMWTADSRTGRPTGAMVTNLPAEVESLYQAYYHRLDPWLGSPRVSRSGRVQEGPELIADAELARSEFYNDFGRRAGLFHVMGYCESLGAGDGPQLGTLSVLRPRRMERFGAENVRRLARLAPHLRRSWQMGQRMGAAPLAPGGDAAALLAGLRGAAIVAEGDGTVRLANAAAERLDAAGAIRLGAGGGLGLVTESGGRPLHAALADAARGGAGGEWLAELSGIGPCRVTVSPLPRAMAEGEGRAMVLLTPQALPPGEETLRRARRLFGFTRTEAEVALALADGRSPNEIARGRAVSITTVRSLLRRALEKAGATDLRGLAVRVTLLRD